MEWAAKRQGAFIASALAIVITAAIFTADILGIDPLDNKALPTPLTCFESATATLRVTDEDSCPRNLISLGNSSLYQIYEMAPAADEMRPLLATRFEAAASTALKEGVHLYISSGYRSRARQAELFEREVRLRGSETEAAKWVLPAAYSHHPLGQAIDVNYPGDKAGALWLEKNGSRFGLCRVYANEWWHFEGVIAPGEPCPQLAPNALVDLP